VVVVVVVGTVLIIALVIVEEEEEEELVGPKPLVLWTLPKTPLQLTTSSDIR